MINLKIRYGELSKSEKKIANFLMSTSQAEMPFYITELAEKCETSEATVVRFAKRLGFDGYQQLKIAIAQDRDSRPINENITKNDSAYDIFSKVCEDIYCSLEKTKNALDKIALQNCCEFILSAKEILIFGLGNSASVANDAAHKLFRLGLNAHAYTDNHMQAIASAHTDENCVVIGISHSGKSKDIVQAMQIAKANGAKTVALTDYGKSPIDKASDLLLHTVSDETNYRILGLNSRIAQLAIVDAIYSYLVCHIPNVSARISETETALEAKKF